MAHHWFFVLLQPALVPTEMALTWEILKGVMLTLTTMGVGWTVRMVFKLRDDTRDLVRAVGTDGRNGLIKHVESHDKRLDAIEDRNLALDTIADIERQQYNGPERRQHTRRLRDHLLPQPGSEEQP